MDPFDWSVIYYGDSIYLFIYMPNIPNDEAMWNLMNEWTPESQFIFEDSEWTVVEQSVESGEFSFYATPW